MEGGFLGGYTLTYTAEYVLPAHRRTLDRDDLEHSLEPGEHDLLANCYEF